MQVLSQVQVLTLQVEVESSHSVVRVKSSQVILFVKSSQVKSQLGHQVIPSRTQASFTHFFTLGVYFI